MLRASIALVGLLLLIGPAAAVDLVVINEANFSIIHQLYIAPAKSQNWSEKAEPEGRKEWEVHNSRSCCRSV